MRKIYPKDFNELEKTILLSGNTLASISKTGGISRQCVHNVFKRKNAVSPKVAKLICEVCEKDFNDLFFIQ